jgi:hypothetical protein
LAIGQAGEQIALEDADISEGPIFVFANSYIIAVAVVK